MTAPAARVVSRAALERSSLPANDLGPLTDADIKPPPFADASGEPIEAIPASADWINQRPTASGVNGEPWEGAASGARSAPDASPLPCPSSCNSDKDEREQALAYMARLGRAIKGAVTLRANVETLCRSYNLDRLGFLTLTLPDNLQYWNREDRKVVSKRWDSFRRGWMDRHGVTQWVRVVEPTKTGRIHLHVLAVFPGDIRTGVDFRQIESGNYRSAGPVLRSLWRELREALPRYGFGRHELLPIKSTSKGIALYVAKYLEKGLEQEWLAEQKCSMRRVMYSSGWRVASLQWTWSTGKAAKWRALVGTAADAWGIQSLEEMRQHLGPHWAWYLLQAIKENALDVYVHGVQHVLNRERTCKAGGEFNYSSYVAANASGS